MPKYPTDSVEEFAYEFGMAEADDDIQNSAIPNEEVAYWRGYLYELERQGKTEVPLGL